MYEPKLVKARHLLEINGDLYGLERHGDAWLIRTPRSRLPYVVSADVCTCPDYGYRGAKDGSPCKHLMALRQVGLLPGPEPTSEAPPVEP